MMDGTNPEMLVEGPSRLVQRSTQVLVRAILRSLLLAVELSSAQLPRGSAWRAHRNGFGPAASPDRV
jgi:hypothetical protein